jgi:hypothetical protein
MDEPVQADLPQPARTAEDFQRWKEQMKAGKTATTITTDQLVQSPSSPEPASSKSHKATKQFVDVEADDSMDKFFAKFNEAKIATEPTAATKPQTKTRFASLFSPPPEQPSAPVAPPPGFDIPPFQSPPSHTPIESPGGNADQAGFARILEMLQGRSQTSTSSQSQESRSRVPLYARDSQPAPEEQPSLPSFLDTLSRSQSDAHPPPPQQRAQDSRSPLEQQHGRQPSNKDAMLLTLLRQANQAPKPTPVSSPLDHHAGRGMFSEDDVNRIAMSRNQMAPQTSFDRMPVRPENGRPLHDNLQHQPMRYTEEPNIHEQLRRRPTGEMPRDHFDPALLNLIRGQPMPEQQKSNVPTQQGPPPGLGRPPGLDMSRPPPGWPQQAPQVQPRAPGGPPGMPNIPRNVPSQYPNPHIPQPQRPQQPPPLQQRKYTGESGMPNFPPMGPPPGFMNGPAPPGFPGTGYGRYQNPPEQPGAGRGFMELYGDMGRGAVRGGAPGAYR